MADLRFRILGTAHRNIYRLTGGKVGGRLGRLPVLLLTTIGRKSGRPRTQPLVYTQVGGGYAVIASKGGAPRDPLWYLNLRANPLAEVTVGRETRRLLARDAQGGERHAATLRDAAEPRRRRAGRSRLSCSSLCPTDAVARGVMEG